MSRLHRLFSKPTLLPIEIYYSFILQITIFSYFLYLSNHAKLQTPLNWCVVCYALTGSSQLSTLNGGKKWSPMRTNYSFLSWWWNTTSQIDFICCLQNRYQVYDWLIKRSGMIRCPCSIWLTMKWHSTVASAWFVHQLYWSYSDPSINQSMWVWAHPFCVCGCLNMEVESVRQRWENHNIYGSAEMQGFWTIKAINERI